MNNESINVDDIDLDNIGADNIGVDNIELNSIKQNNLCFAHMADCHIGGWRDAKLRDLNFQSFEKAIDVCIQKKIDFLLISGDLFNNSFPGIIELKGVVRLLRKLKDRGIPVYTVAGSHDFSPSGKTILDVLEEAGLLVNVCVGDIIDDKLKLKFTQDPKTGVKLTGMIGKRGMLEKRHYSKLVKDNLETDDGFKIFLFHTALDELKPKELEKMESAPVSLLPKNFDYYAGGHVHIVEHKDVGEYKNLVYPGPIFPNSFSEIEKLKRGGFSIYENGLITYQPIVVCNMECISLNCDMKTAQECEELITTTIRTKQFYNSVVTLRLFGQLREGKTTEIDWKKIYKEIYDKSALIILKNSSKLTSKEFQEINVVAGTAEEIEQKLIEEHVGQFSRANSSEQIFDLEKESKKIKLIMEVLDLEKDEGEKVADFEKKLEKEADSVINL